MRSRTLISTLGAFTVSAGLGVGPAAARVCIPLTPICLPEIHRGPGTKHLPPPVAYDAAVFVDRAASTATTAESAQTMATPATLPPPIFYEAKEFIIFFPFNQDALTPEAQAEIAEAAVYAKSGSVTSITIVGHADRSGPATYNIGLSEQRAKAVAGALILQGISPSKLSVDWKGESQPAVPTPEGVKEPLNRRATISINF